MNCEGVFMKLQVKPQAANTAYESIYDILRRRIIQFELLPGQILSENNLASVLGVSRTPVRDALSRLAEEGCIHVYPQRGTEVSYISLERVRQAVFLCTVLEQDVLEQLCTEGVSDEEFEQLENSLRLQRRYYDQQCSEKLLEEDTRLHRLLYAFCGRGIAWTAIDAIDCDLMRIRYLQICTYSYKVQMSAVASWENSLTEYRMMLSALQKRDVEAVSLLSSNHISQVIWDIDNLRRIYPTYFTSDI
jgi:DNA-binding GntR family transcriptional regulator